MESKEYKSKINWDEMEKLWHNAFYNEKRKTSNPLNKSRRKTNKKSKQSNNPAPHQRK